MRTYSELITLPTWAERYNYLKLDGEVGRDTFGFDRYLNQDFYRSRLWRQVRTHVIARDMGNDLGVDGIPIDGKIIIHHMNPIMLKDLTHENELILDPEYLICVSHKTHNGIHYGINLDPFRDLRVVERSANDTCPWRK